MALDANLRLAADECVKDLESVRGYPGLDRSVRIIRRLKSRVEMLQRAFHVGWDFNAQDITDEAGDISG